MNTKTIGKRIRDILFGVLSFFLALFLFLDAVCALASMTVLNEESWMEQMTVSGYYSEKEQEITKKLVQLGNASGLPSDFFEDVIDLVQIQKDMQNYMDSYFDGTSRILDTTPFQQKFRAALDRFIEEKNAKVDGKSVDNLVKQAKQIYSGNLEIPLFIKLSSYLQMVRNYLPYIIGGLSLLSGVIILVLLLANKWRHRAFKYYYYACAGTGLCLLALSVYLTASGGLKKIVLESKALYQMVVSFGSSVTVYLWVLTAVFAVLALSMFFLYRTFYLKAAGSTD